MIKRQSLHAGYERLVGAALVDTELRLELLKDPRATALAFGIAQSDAELVADIRALDLRSFSVSLTNRLYGMDRANVFDRSVAAG